MLFRLQQGEAPGFPYDIGLVVGCLPARGDDLNSPGIFSASTGQQVTALQVSEILSFFRNQTESAKRRANVDVGSADVVHNSSDATSCFAVETGAELHVE